MTEPLWMWVFFIVLVLGLLTLDLGVFHKKNKPIGLKESLLTSAIYISIALLFGLWIWYQLDFQRSAEYLTAFLVEKSLSLDNIFLIAIIFSGLSIPLKYQHRILFWGILGVIILRGIMIGIGAELIMNFAWIIYIFSAFMIFTGIKMFFIREKISNIEKNIFLKLLRKYFRVTDTIHGQKFWVRKLDPKTKKRHFYMTPLLVALLIIECTDLIFAVDSIPAVFTITQDPYIVYTSNIFAILGLRALYFALAVILERLHYLKFALALVLIFIGSKVFILKFTGIEKFPPALSLGITFGLLAGGCLYSMYRKPVQKN